MKLIPTKIVLNNDEIDILLMLDRRGRIINDVVGRGRRHIAIRLGRPIIDIEPPDEEVTSQFSELVEKLRKFYPDMNIQVGLVPIDAGDVTYVELFKYRGKMYRMHVIEFVDSFIICRIDMLSRLKMLLVEGEHVG